MMSYDLVEKYSCDTVSLLHIISPASNTTSTHDIVLEDIVTHYEKNACPWGVHHFCDVIL